MSGDPRALLDHLDALHAAATAGPWEATTPRADGGAYIDTVRTRLADGSAPWVGRAVREPDAACIVAEHNATPKLTAAVRAVLDLADELEHEKGSIQGNVARLLAASRLRAAVTAHLSPAQQESGR